MNGKAGTKEINNHYYDISISFVIVVLIFVATFTCTDSCVAKDLYTLRGEYSSTSDDIELYTAHFDHITNRRKYYWPYKESSASTMDVGVVLNHFRGQANSTRFIGWQAEQVLGWQFSPAFYMRTGIGFHLLDVDEPEGDKSLFIYDIEAQYEPVNNLNLNFKIVKDFVYQIGVQPAGVREALHANQTQGGFEWYPVDVIRVIGSTSDWDLSDDNNRRENKLNILYGISPDWPWIWTGIFFEKLHYKDAKPDYWTPEEFTVRGLIIESSFAITEKISGNLAANISKIKEDDYPEGDGSAIFVGLDFKMLSEQVLRLGFRQINSKQGKTKWDEQAISLSLNGTL